MKSIVLYKSKYGSAKQYAQWIAEALGAEIAETGSLKPAELEKFDRIIVGGGIYAGGIKGFSWFKKHYPSLAGKKIAVFAVGASPCEEDTVNEVVKANLEPDFAQLPVFYLRGKWDEANMGFFDRNLSRMLKRSIQKKPESEREGWESALMEASDRSSGVATSWISKDQIEPLVVWGREG